MNFNQRLAASATAVIRSVAVANLIDTLDVTEDTILMALRVLREELESRWALVSISAFLVGVTVGAVAV